MFMVGGRPSRRSGATSLNGLTRPEASFRIVASYAVAPTTEALLTDIVKALALGLAVLTVARRLSRPHTSSTRHDGARSAKGSAAIRSSERCPRQPCAVPEAALRLPRVPL